ILTTGLFFVGMYLLAKRKVEHWILLIVGDFISIPLYYFKGYTITAILFLAYTVIATLGYLEWKKIWKRENPDRKSTRLNSSHVKISYAVFCLKKKKKIRKR